MTQKIKIRWLIAHEPVQLFLRTAEAFADHLTQSGNNHFEIEIFTPAEYDAVLTKENKDILYNLGPMPLIEAGDIQMCQLHVTELAAWQNSDFYALEMPFIFTDHAHAARVLEGDIGKGLLNSLAERGPSTGLAFTYSGGFRCVVSDSKLSKLDDFHGLTYATTTNPVTIDMVKLLGANVDPFPIRDFVKKTTEGHCASALETTIPRYLAQFQNTNKKFMLNTKHTLFLTSIVIGTKFLESLNAEDRAAIDAATLYASRLERVWSVDEAVEFANTDHSDIGVTYAELSVEETDKFKKITEPLYDKYKDFFSPSLVDGIIRA